MGRRLLDSAHYLVWKHSRAARQRCPQRFRPGTTYAKGSCTESSVDDLGTCRGVVLSRAAAILRSIETQPLTGRFVRFDEQPSNLFFTLSPRVYVPRENTRHGTWPWPGALSPSAPARRLELWESEHKSLRGLGSSAQTPSFTAGPQGEGHPLPLEKVSLFPYIYR